MSPVDDISLWTRSEAVTRLGEGGPDLTPDLAEGGVEDVLDRDHRHGGRVQLVRAGRERGALVTRLGLTGQGGLGPDLPADVDNQEDAEEGGEDGDGHTHHQGGHVRVGVTLNTFPDMIVDEEISALTVGAGRGTVLC